jgi:hypothetical protein
MARDLTSNLIDELEANLNRPFFLFEGVFQSSTLRFWTGSGVLSWDSKTWQGNGLFVGLKLAAETSDIEANGIEVQLSGVSSSIVSLVLNEVQQGKQGNIWLGMVDSSGQVIADPYKVFTGGFDTAEINEDPDSPTITIKYETKLIILEKAADYRYTPESQKLFDATDKGFDYVANIQDWDGFWGKQNRKPKKKKRKEKEK